jgi:hypothetical protein
MRERDVRNAIKTALWATGVFDDIWLTGLPEDYGRGASQLRAAAIEPAATALATGWDAPIAGGLDFKAQCIVTLLARHEDPQLRDELAEQLLDTLHNAVNGQSLAGFTLPVKTLVTSWLWQPPLAPERRITATVSFAYLVTWEGWDVSS